MGVQEHFRDCRSAIRDPNRVVMGAERGGWCNLIAVHPERIRFGDLVHDSTDNDQHFIAVKARAADYSFTIVSAHLRPDAATKACKRHAFIDRLDQLDPPVLVTGDLNSMVSSQQTVPNIEAVFRMNEGQLQGLPERISHHDLQ